MIDVIRISMPLLSHIAKSQNKIAKDRYWKINNQAIYNGTINTFTRALIVDNMHKYIASYIPENLHNRKLKKIISISYHFFTVINHGDITRRNDKLCWKPAKEDYQPTWDLNNMADFWVKTGNDTLSLVGLITDDNVSVINDERRKIDIVDDISELRLDILIMYNTEENE